jgi:serine/threonine protein kinase
MDSAPAAHFFLNGPLDAVPFPFKENLDHYEHFGQNNLLYNSQTLSVCKLMDRKTFDIPKELLKTIDGVDNPNWLENELLPVLHRRSLSKDGRYCEISYSYVDGSHKPVTLEQFIGVVKILDFLHTHGFVHGDVRLSNIIFHGQSSTLIDFDLCKEENQEYPSDYKFYEDERHEKARAGGLMKKMHDRYALALIIQKYIKDVHKNIISSLCDEQTPLHTMFEHFK